MHVTITVGSSVRFRNSVGRQDFIGRSHQIRNYNTSSASALWLWILVQLPCEASIRFVRKRRMLVQPRGVLTVSRRIQGVMTPLISEGR